MNKENTRKLLDRFSFIPRANPLYRIGSGVPMSIDCGDGWFNLLWKLCEDIDRILARPENTRPKEHFAVDQIKEKFACYDEETELLTINGWKVFRDVTRDDYIATLNKKDELEYQPPIDIISYLYEGKMYKLNTGGIDLLVTPNHNLYVARGDYYGGGYPENKKEHSLELTSPQKYFGYAKRFQKGAKWYGKPQQIFLLPNVSFGIEHIKDSWDREYIREKIRSPKQFSMHSWLAFLGWYVAEGCADIRGNISIAFNTIDGGVERETIEKIVKDLGLNPRNHAQGGVIRIYDKQLALWLRENCGIKAPDKKAPSFIKKLSSEQIEVFLHNLYLGDGHKTPTSHILVTVSKHLADDVQELILKTGSTSRIYSPREPSKTGKGITGKHKIYGINWLKNGYYRNTHQKGLGKHGKEEWVDYHGLVYCVTVPNHIIYIRRNGKPVWCGNSLRFYVSGSNDEIELLIDRAEYDSYHTCEECGGLGKPREGGWYRTLCDKHAEERGQMKVLGLKWSPEYLERIGEKEDV